MKVTSLFSGIGGLEKGLSESGHETQLFCEIMPAAREVLEARFAGTPIAADVRALNSLPASTELVTAGFPCQDLSQAGLTAGIGGDRSSLVGRVFRLIDAEPVPWVLLENVSFMLQLDQGHAMTTLVDAFEARGYRWAYRVVNSLAYLPQRRERVIFLATRTDSDPADVLMVDDVVPPERMTGLGTHAHGFYWTEGVRGLGWAQDAIPTLKNGSTIGIPSPPAILLPSGLTITPDIRDAERLQGFAADWTKPAERAARASCRWTLIGNAVTVPVAGWIGRRLTEPGRYDRSADRQLESAKRWPRAARGEPGRRLAVRIGDYPEWRERTPLAAFLEHSGKPLSARATRGFLGRTERGSLRFVPGFRESLRSHLEVMEAVESGFQRPLLAAE